MLSRPGFLLVLASLPLFAAEVPAAAPSAPTTAASSGQQNPLPARYCLRETGTRIKSQKTCTPGEVITREELEQAGGMTLSEKLPRLSTAIQRSGN